MKAESQQSNYPQHIAIIMDGNGRWAKSHGEPRTTGHTVGVESVKSVVQFCSAQRIPFVTLFAFGQDNNKRPIEEVNFIMGLFAHQLVLNAPDLMAENVKIKVIGDQSNLDTETVAAIADAEAMTADCTGLQLTFALNYCGRWDVVEATKTLSKQVATGVLQTQQLSPELLQQALPSACIPEVDLMIRTGGESRLSDFLLWQLAYAELYFTPVAWPDFHQAQLQEACSWFADRERRFGKISEQI